MGGSLFAPSIRKSSKEDVERAGVGAEVEEEQLVRGVADRARLGGRVRSKYAERFPWRSVAVLWCRTCFGVQIE